MQAEYVRDVNCFPTKGKLYKLSKRLEGFSYVIVEALVSDEPQTLIYGSNKHGEIKSWKPLEGSQLGVLDYNRVLTDLGYEV